jgi:hypothetical protein
MVPPSSSRIPEASVLLEPVSTSSPPPAIRVSALLEKSYRLHAVTRPPSSTSRSPLLSIPEVNDASLPAPLTRKIPGE